MDEIEFDSKSMKTENNFNQNYEKPKLRNKSIYLNKSRNYDNEPKSIYSPKSTTKSVKSFKDKKSKSKNLCSES